MNMTVSVKERIPKQRTERRAYVIERARESDSLLVRTDRPGLSMQYKLIATTDASLSDAEKHLRTVYSVLIIKTEQDLFGITDETVFIYDVARNRDAADRLLALLAGGCVSPAKGRYRRPALRVSEREMLYLSPSHKAHKPPSSQ